VNRVLTSVINVNVGDIETAGTTTEYRKVTLEKVRGAIAHLNEVKKAL
jgi:hypothetical protein